MASIRSRRTAARSDSRVGVGARALAPERLEERTVPSASPTAWLGAAGLPSGAPAVPTGNAALPTVTLTAPTADATEWITWEGQRVEVFPRQWVVRFDGVSGAVADQIAAVRRTLSNTGEDFAVLDHLGADGLVLVRTPAGVAPEDALAALRAVAAVDDFEPNEVVRAQLTPNDPSFGLLDGLNNTGQDGGVADADIDAPEAWNIGTGSRSVVVGVIDSGTDYTHQDLYRNIWVNQGEIPASRKSNLTDTDGDGLITFADLNNPANQGPDKITDQNGDGRIDGSDLLAPLSGSGGGWADSTDGDGDGKTDDIIGWDFANNDNNPMDDNHHGTHVAGTIGAVGNNATGVTGVNWNVQIMPLKFLDASGNGSTANAIAAVNYANAMRDKGVNIRATSNSWGGGGLSSLLESAISDSATRGMLFVAAAGNNGGNNDTTAFYPASYTEDNVIAVAATDDRDNRASFSQYGLTSVDLAAPGVSIYSTLPGNAYGYLSGTSMATPHVTGAAALLWAVNPNATYQQVRGALFATVDPVPDYSTTGTHPVATGGRLNLYRAVRQIALSVSATTPAVGSTVTTTPPASYAVTFLGDLDPATLQASDFTVDGVPATGVTYDAPNRRATFTFTTNPVTADGLHTMAIADGAIATAQGVGVVAFGGQFRYDSVPLAVTGTTPAANGLLPIDTGGAVVRVNFDEPVNPATVAASDFAVTVGSVGGVTMVPGNQAVDVSIGGLAAEGSLTLSAAAGAFADPNGAPNPSAFSAAYQLDYNTRAFPTLAAVNPLGSRVYSATSPSGLINTAADTDSFTVALDAGQTATVIVRPTSGDLQPRVELFDGSNNSVGGPAGAAAADLPVAVTRPIAGAGTYRIAVSSAAGTGSYTVEVLLNAATETEALLGAANDTAAAAQNLDPAFATESTALASAARTAVRGTAAGFVATAVPPTFTDISATGTVITALTGTNNATASVPIGFNFTFFGQTYTSLFVSSNGLITFGSGNTSAANVAMDNASAPSQAAIAPFWDDLNVTNSAGTARVRYLLSGPAGSRTLTVQWDKVTFASGGTGSDPITFQAVLSESSNAVQFNYPDLTSGTAAGNEGAGATVGVKAASPVGLQFLNVANPGPNALVGTGKSTLLTPAAAPDYYSFTAAAGDAATLALQSLTTGNADVQLIGTDGTTVLASGTAGAANLNEAIQNFALPGAGTYYVRVTGDPNVSYDLVVARRAAFDAEANNTAATAQPLGPSRAAIGSVTAGEADWYSVTLPAGNTMLRVETGTPGDGAGQFANALNPKVEVFDATGTVLLGTGTALPDGRNEAATLQNLAAGGTYLIRLTGENSTAGEYLLGVTPLVAAAPTGVLVNGTTAPSASYTASRVTSLVVAFNTAVSALDPGAFSLTRGSTTLTSGGGGISVAGVGTASLTLTFANVPGVEFGSLADGIWTLTTDGTKVRNGSGVAGVGSTATGNIRRLFGDYDGNGVVNSDDFDQLGNVFGLSSAVFDYDGNGVVNSDDFDQFGNRFGLSL